MPSSGCLEIAYVRAKVCRFFFVCGVVASDFVTSPSVVAYAANESGQYSFCVDMIFDHDVRNRCCSVRYAIEDDTLKLVEYMLGPIT